MILAVLALGIFATSCSSDDDNSPSTAILTLNLNGLEELGNDFVYEGWIIVNGSPVSTGTFSSVTFPQTYTVDADDLASASTFVLSIEPAVDSDPSPATTKILAGDFSGGSANVSTSIIEDFSSVAGSFILATPTDNAGGINNDNNENGIWWLNPTTTPPTPTLVLPTLPTGWKYEGWVVAGGIPITTGTFTNVAATDDDDPFSGSEPLAMPNGTDGFFPGEDFLLAAPSGVTFPLDVRGKTAVISIEPDPDNSTSPFTLKPLVGTAGMMTAPALSTMMSNVSASFPTGTVTR